MKSKKFLLLPLFLVALTVLLFSGCTPAEKKEETKTEIPNPMVEQASTAAIKEALALPLIPCLPASRMSNTLLSLTIWPRPTSPLTASATPSAKVMPSSKTLPVFIPISRMVKPKSMQPGLPSFTRVTLTAWDWLPGPKAPLSIRLIAKPGLI